MKYYIYQNNEYINTIVADEDFVQSYCQDNGYTYTTIEEQTIIAPPTDIEQLRADIDYLAIMTGVTL